LKIVLDCDRGGHFAQMMEIARYLDNHKISIIYPDAGGRDITKNDQYFYIPIKVLNTRYRFGFFFTSVLEIFRGVLSFPRCLHALLKEKPDIIISTRSLLTLELLLSSKILGIKFIYVESLTRVSSKSGTGKLAYYLADVFLVQWKCMTKLYPKSKYWGKVI